MLTSDEIRTPGSASMALADPIPAFIKTLMSTGVRREEARGARWAEVDLDAKLWVIPGSRTKNGRSHEVPLSTAMLDILADVPRRGPYVFTRDSEGPLADMSGLKAAVDKASGITGWRRTTCCTRCCLPNSASSTLPSDHRLRSPGRSTTTEMDAEEDGGAAGRRCVYHWVSVMPDPSKVSKNACAEM